MNQIIYRHDNKNCLNKRTIAVQRRDDRYHVAVANCSKKDNYCKETGRDVAAARLDDTDIFVTLEDLNLLSAKSDMLTQKKVEELNSTITLDDIKIHYILQLATDKIDGVL